MYQALYSWLAQLDRQLFLLINQLHHPWLDRIVYWVTHELFWIPLYAFLLYLVIKHLRTKSWMALVAVVFLITICDQFASGLIKPWVQRLRPCFHPALQDFVHIVGRNQGLYGFISSHAANSFGLATFLYLLLQERYPSIRLLFIWALVVSYARIYGGVHYPGDMIIGALSGVGWGWMMFRLYGYMSQITTT